MNDTWWDVARHLDETRLLQWASRAAYVALNGSAPDPSTRAVRHADGALWFRPAVLGRRCRLVTHGWCRVVCRSSRPRDVAHVIRAIAVGRRCVVSGGDQQIATAVGIYRLLAEPRPALEVRLRPHSESTLAGVPVQYLSLHMGNGRTVLRDMPPGLRGLQLNDYPAWLIDLERHADHLVSLELFRTPLHRSLGCLARLQRLRLSGCPLYTADVLARFTELRSLELVATLGRLDGLRELLAVVARLPLVRLRIDNDLLAADRDCVELVAALERMDLEMLSLRGQFLGDADVALMTPALVGMPRLRSLDLGCNQLSRASLARLAAALPRVQLIN